MASPHATPLPASCNTSTFDTATPHSHDGSNDAWIAQMVRVSSIEEDLPTKGSLSSQGQTVDSTETAILSPPPAFVTSESRTFTSSASPGEVKTHRHSIVEGPASTSTIVEVPSCTSAAAIRHIDSTSAMLLTAHIPDTRVSSSSALDADIVFAHDWPAAKKAAHLCVFGIFFLIAEILRSAHSEFLRNDSTSPPSLKQSLTSQTFEIGAACGTLIATALPAYGRHCTAPVLVMGMAAVCTIAGFSKATTVVATLRAVLGCVSCINVVMYTAMTLDMSASSSHRIILFLVVLCGFALAAQASAPWIVRGIEEHTKSAWRYWAVAAACVCHVALAGCLCDESNDDGIRQRHSEKSTRRSIGGESVTLENIWRHMREPITIIARSLVSLIIALLLCTVSGTTSVLVDSLPSVLAFVHGTGPDYVGITLSISYATAIVSLVLCAALQMNACKKSITAATSTASTKLTRATRRLLLVTVTGIILSGIVLSIVANAADTHPIIAALALAALIHFVALTALLCAQYLAFVYCLASDESRTVPITGSTPESSILYIHGNAHLSAAEAGRYHVSMGTKVVWATTTTALLLSTCLFASIIGKTVSSYAQRHVDFAVTSVIVTCINVVVPGALCLGMLFFLGDKLTSSTQRRMLGPST